MSQISPAERAFDAWASSFALVPKPAHQFIRNAEETCELAAFLTTSCEGRRLVWKEVAYRGTGRVEAPPLRPADVSPWTIADDTLRRRSDHVATCDHCQGEGKHLCGYCRGTGQFICASCSGSGKYYGYARNGARRLLNCKNCHGRGTTSCPNCRRGVATCAACEGQKRLQRWLEIERWKRTEETAYPRGVNDPPLSWRADADNGMLEQDAMVVADVSLPRPLTTDDLRGDDQQWLQRTTAQAAQPPTTEERIVCQRLRIVSIPRTRISYGIGSHAGEIDFVGKRMLPVAAHAELRLFEVRARRLRSTAIAFAIVIALTALGYLGRGTFYAHAAGLSALLLLAAAFVAAFMLIADATAQRRRLKAWGIAAGATAALSAVCFVVAHPGVADARGRLVRGDVAGAVEELAVLDGADRGVPELWADVHLVGAKTARTYNDALSEAAAIPRDLPQYRAAVSAADIAIEKAVGRALNEGNMKDAAAALEAASDAWRQSAAGRNAAERIYVQRAMTSIDKLQWRAAADDLMAARKAGVDTEHVSSAAEKLRREAARRTREAATMATAAKRLIARLNAEETWIQWEHATGKASPELVSLRASMAGDLRDAERKPRRAAS